MILWTIHNAKWVHALESDGRIKGDWRRVWRDLVPAYRWMADQMAARGHCEGRDAPVWAWLRDDSGGRPDLRTHRWRCRRGERNTRVEFDAPDELVLLSLEEAWHCVLNGGPCTHSEQEFESIWPNGEPCRLSRAEIRQTWHRIFDLTGGDPSWCGHPEARRIQACLPYIDASWIRRVDWFVGCEGR